MRWRATLPEPWVRAIEDGRMTAPSRLRAAFALLVVASLAGACGSLSGTASPGAPGGTGVASRASGSSVPSAAASDAQVGSPPSGTSGSAAPGTSASASSAGGGTVTAGGPSIPDLVEQVRPSVVAILRADGAQGSGVIARADGVIITNDHVVEGVRTVTVLYADGRRDQGDVKATDPRSDLAVVRVDRTGLPAATFRDDEPRVGELALAIGNPLGFAESVTAGIVSGLGRSIPGSASTSPALIDLIQTDAAISPGNSGGGLVSGDGRFMGINVAYIPPSGGAVSIGFAIPSPTVTDVVDQLLTTGHVQHAYLGVSPATVDQQTAAAYALPVDAGAVLVDVVADGPAAKAGLKPGDIVTRVGDSEITSAEDLLTALRKHAPGDEVTVHVVRDTGETDVKATLGDLPSEPPQAP
jgi:serine protease DegQ